MKLKGFIHLGIFQKFCFVFKPYTKAVACVLVTDCLEALALFQLTTPINYTPSTPAEVLVHSLKMFLGQVSAEMRKPYNCQVH